MLFAVALTVVTQLALCIYTLVFLDNEVPDQSDFEVGFMQRRSLRILTILSLTLIVILLLLITYLLTYHVYLIVKDTTTYKHIRSQQKRKTKSRVIREKPTPTPTP